jgi:hypothetical protein
MTNLAMQILDKPINTVYSCYNYSKFNILKGNRNIVNTNLNNLRKSFEIQDLDIPIIVNERYEIVDGQHRFLVRQELNLPIPYIMVKGYSLKECKLLNTVGQKWTSDTFLNSYCDQEYEDYILVRNFMDKYKISLEKALPFFIFQTTKGTARQSFKNGTFKVLDINKTERFFEQYLDFREAPAFNSKLFSTACIQLFKVKAYSHKTMKEKLEYQAYKLKVRSFLSEYTELLLDVYNYKTRDGKKLKI